VKVEFQVNLTTVCWHAYSTTPKIANIIIMILLPTIISQQYDSRQWLYYYISYAATSLVSPCPVASSEKSREARSCNFQTGTNFGNEKLWVLKNSNLPPNFPKMEDYQRQNSPKWAKLRESCTPQHHNFLVGLNSSIVVELVNSVQVRVVVLESWTRLQSHQLWWFIIKCLLVC